MSYHQYIPLVAIGMIFLGIILLVGYSIYASGTGKSNVAVGGFIGPIPFGFAKDYPVLQIIMIVLFIITIIMFFVR